MGPEMSPSTCYRTLKIKDVFNRDRSRRTLSTVLLETGTGETGECLAAEGLPPADALDGDRAGPSCRRAATEGWGRSLDFGLCPMAADPFTKGWTGRVSWKIKCMHKLHPCSITVAIASLLFFEKCRKERETREHAYFTCFPVDSRNGAPPARRPTQLSVFCSPSLVPSFSARPVVGWQSVYAAKDWK